MKRKSYERNRRLMPGLRGDWIKPLKKMEKNMMQIKFNENETLSTTKSGYVRINENKLEFDVIKWSIYEETKLVKTVMHVEWKNSEIHHEEKNNIIKAENRIKEMFNHI